MVVQVGQGMSHGISREHGVNERFVTIGFAILRRVYTYTYAHTDQLVRFNDIRLVTSHNLI